MRVLPINPEPKSQSEDGLARPAGSLPLNRRVAGHEIPKVPSETSAEEAQLSDERVYFGLLQTVTTTFLSGRALLPLQISAVCAQNRTRIFDYGFARGRQGFPLVFLIPGFGCSYNHGTVLYLTEKLVARGFHVAVLHSPSHPEFLMSSHHSGIGGIFSEDAKDALLGMSAIADHLCGMGVDYKQKHLVGYSMGALNAGFARTIETKMGAKLFDRVVLINPPVDLAHGTVQLDGFVKALNMPRIQKARLAMKAGLAILLPRTIRRDRLSLIQTFLDRPIWTDAELRALIGSSFEGTVSGGMKVAAVLGALTAEQVVRTFSDYCELATVPHYRRRFNPDATMIDFYRTESLLRIANDLAADGNVYLLHNEDDFLLRPRDVAWMKSSFGKTATVFETGGHLGNVWRPEFQAALEAALGI